MNNSKKNYLSKITKYLDYLAVAAFIFSAAVAFSVGNISAGSANCCAILWVFIARSRQNSADTYSEICDNMFNLYDTIKDECIELKNKLAAIVKDNANDSRKSQS